MLFGRRWNLKDILILVALVFASAIFLFPILLVVSVSFKAPIDIMAMPPKWLFQPTLENYRALLGLVPSEFKFDLWLHFRNSILAASGATFLSLLLGTPAAYAFARVSFRGSQTMLLSLLAVRMLPPIATVIPLFLIMRELHLVDSVIGLVIAYTTFNLPFITWIMRSFFLDLPRELEESGWIDGATRWQAFRLLILPLSLPGLVASAIFGLMLAWNDFLFAVILTSRDAPTLPMMTAGFVTDQGVSWGIMMAAGAVIIVPVLVFTLFVQRFLVSGLTSGAMKG
ncbi:MAG: carbohydrate ABC transporter permease [Proteobacteria bacterium]|nr:carbohydrate ABC transporter permease [Pseudomonadota bacterium]